MKSDPPRIFLLGCVVNLNFHCTHSTLRRTNIVVNDLGAKIMNDGLLNELCK